MENFRCFIIAVFLFIGSNLISQDFTPFPKDIVVLYLNNTNSAEQQPYYVSSKDAYDASMSTNRAKDWSDCQWFVMNRWLGESINVDSLVGRYDFLFHSIIDNKSQGVLTLSVFPNYALGQTWLAEPTYGIQAQVVDISPTTWEGIQDTIKTIELTATGFSWQSGEIKISKNYGIVEFPNLQYFPHDWINVDRRGIQDMVGVQDFSGEAALAMNPGDILQTERLEEFYPGSTGGRIIYTNKECLRIIEASNAHQVREVKVDTYTRKLSDVDYMHNTEIKVETVDYSAVQLTDVMKNNNIHYRLYPDSTKQIDSLYFIDSLIPYTCMQDPIDLCDHKFAILHGMDIFFDCDNTISYRYHYIPLYTLHDGSELGIRQDFSRLSNHEVVEINQATISPNPSSGEFSIEPPAAEKIIQYNAMDVQGRSFRLTESNGKYTLSAPDGIYILTGQSVDGNPTLVGKLIINNR